MTRATRVLGYLMGFALLLGSTLATVGQDKTKKAAEKAPTHKVEKGPFKIEVTVKGVFEAQAMAPVAFRPEAWGPQAGGPLVVRKAVEHGATVRKGDPLVWLDTDKLDQAIRDLDEERHLADLAIKLAEKELPVLTRLLPKDLDAAERSKKVADEDLQEFVEKGRPYMEKSAEFDVKMVRNFLDYAKEELRQLEKMYKASDLTEETEQIILRRYRNEVEQVQFMLGMAERRRDNVLKIVLPRQDVQLKERAEKEGLSLEKATATLPLTLNQKELALNKLHYDRAKAGEKLAKMKRDRDGMTATAPADGVVYYGRCVRGVWTTAAGMADKLQAGGQLQADEVVLTIVQPKGLFVRVELDEKDLPAVRPGAEAKVVPTALPDVRLRAKVESVPGVPFAAGKFVGRVTVETAEAAAAVVPGMACTVKVVPYLKADALTVPAVAVFPDELDDDQHYVYVPTDGEPARRTVKVGRKTDARVEILEGLRAGEEILQARPTATAPATPATPATPTKKEGKS